MNILEHDALWDDPAKAKFTLAHMARIRDGGFSHVRINMHAFRHMDKASRIAGGWLATLDRLIDEARRAGLMVILDEHDFQPCGEAPDTCRTRLLAVWEQLAARYVHADDGVLFEILNEPNKRLTPELWNGLLADVLAVIRRTNPGRTVIVGPGNYNHFKALKDLALPAEDRNLIVTVHYYDPFRFTHQGATWTAPSRENDTGIGWGEEAERRQVETDMDTVAAWSREQDRPVMIGEFGVFDKAPVDARAAWLSAVARAAEARGFSWSYWQFEGTFGVFDIAGDQWIAPIHDALMARGSPTGGDDRPSVGAETR